VEIILGDGLINNNVASAVFQNNNGDRCRVMGTMRATVTSSMLNNPKTYVSVLLLILVSVTVLAIVVDLLVSASRASSSSVQEVFQVTNVSLDVSQPIPVAQVELVFDLKSRWSRVEPQDLTCTLDGANGAAITVVAAKNDNSDQYLLQVTCPEHDVEAHAALLWNVLTRNKDSTERRRLGEFHCSATIKAYLGHVLPVSHTVSFDFSGDDLVKGIEDLKEQEQDALVQPGEATKAAAFDSSGDDWVQTIENLKKEQEQDALVQSGEATKAAAFDSSGDDWVQTIENLKKEQEQDALVQSGEATKTAAAAAAEPMSSLAIAIRQVHLNQMEVGVRLQDDSVPNFVYDLTPTLNVKLPPLNIVVQPSDSAGIVLYTQGLEATFVKKRQHQEQITQELVFGVASNTESTSNPWFGPIMGLYSRSKQRTTVQVSGT
jgi:hypothetical protein